jgi:phosphoribosylformylglycinamidine synthase
MHEHVHDNKKRRNYALPSPIAALSTERPAMCYTALPAMLAKVYVRMKEGVLDPQGRAVLGALHSLGFTEVEDSRVGRYIELRLGGISRPEAEARVKEMCQKLLANTIIEDFRFEILEG